MKSGLFILLFYIVFAFFAGDLMAQKWVNPHMDAHRLDYRDLGYPAANEIPADDSPITALLPHSNGRIYGATTGKQSYLFAYDSKVNKVFPLGKIANAGGVHHCLLEGNDGKIYIGSGLNELQRFNLTKSFPRGRRAIEEQLWKDIKGKYANFEGGHIYQYDPAEGDSEIYFDDEQAMMTDLGIPVSGNTIYAMTFNLDKSKIYGISYPDARLFVHDLESGQSTDLGPWLAHKSYAGPERSWRSVPRALIAAADGKIYSSGDDGLITYYDPATGKIQPATMRIPGEYWEAWNYDGYPVVEQLITEDGNTIYGSTSDGFIFKMKVDTQALHNLGKPRWSRRVRGMTLGPDRRLYMLCGEFEEVCKMYSYDISGKETGFVEYGVLGVDRSPYYAKRPYQFDAMTTGPNGSIFIGESDRRAKLFIYTPGAGVFEGVLNPTNPR